MPALYDWLRAALRNPVFDNALRFSARVILLTSAHAYMHMRKS
jgi:hypothetical protein